MADKRKVREYSRELIRATFEKRAPEPIPEGLSIDDLIDICNKGQIQYLFMNSLMKITEDEDKRKLMSQALTYSTIKTFTQMMAARNITETLEKEGVRHQLLKGSVTKLLYPSPEMREMSDVDLVIYDESLDKTAKVLESMGFKNHGLIKHHMIFSKNPGLVVEAHWCLFDANAGHQQHVYFEDEIRAKLAEGKNYTYEFGHEDFYVYMVAHMAKHFFETGCGIRNLLDIYVYLNKYDETMDKAYLEGELKKCGIYDFEKSMRELAYIWMDGKECSEYFENLFAYMVDSGIYGKNENGVWSQLAKETAGGSKNLKIHYYFPSYSFMKEKYPWLSKVPFLLPVAWVMRGVSGLSNKKSREHRDTLENAGKEEIEQMLEIYHKLNLNFRREQ